MTAKISTYLIGIVIFTLLIVGGITMITMLGDSNGDIVNNPKYTEFNKTANKYEQLEDSIATIQDSIQNDPDTGTLGVLSALINTAWNTLKTLPSMFGFMVTAYAELSTFFGIPLWIPGLLSGIIVIIIVFVLYGAFLQHDL